MNALQKADDHIAKFKGKVNGKYRLKYHLYYQFYPYDSLNGVMHWGHFVSQDLIAYTDAGVALAPEERGENIFSGGAVEADGALNAFYTLHYELDGVKTEKIYREQSVDGHTFTGKRCVFDNESLPENISRTDFRDPCPVKAGDGYGRVSLLLQGGRKGRVGCFGL